MDWKSEYQTTHVLCRRLAYWESVYFTSATTMSNWQVGFSEMVHIYLNITSLPFLVLSCIVLIRCLLGKDVTLSLKTVKHL